jgi:hypothetical protein
VRLYGAPDEWSDFQARQILYAVDADTRTLMQIDVIRVEVADDIEQRDQPSVSLVVDGVCEEYRVCAHKAGLFSYFPVQRVFDGFAILDGTAEPGPAARIGDSGLVVMVVQEQTGACHDQQHRCPAPRLSFFP